MNDQTVLLSGLIEQIGEKTSHTVVSYAGEEVTKKSQIMDHARGVEQLTQLLLQSGMINSFQELDAITHRVVHGGEKFKDPTRITQEVIDTIEELIPLAPLHNPANLEGIKLLQKLTPDIPHIAVFDTAFHQSMPAQSYLYAIPYELYTQEGVRRYGFHGTSHHYVAQRCARHLNRPLQELNIISLHLGNGSSAAAIKVGKSIDTSMGFTPLEGLVMGTRSGDIDAGALLYLLEKGSYTVEALDRLLNKQSGLKGICGENDLRQLLEKSKKGDEQAQLALDIFIHRIKKYIGAYATLLNRVDAVIFTGGIGEHSSEVRAAVCDEMDQSLGIILDPVKNERECTDLIEISDDKSTIKLFAVMTDEELEMALQSDKFLRS